MEEKQFENQLTKLYPNGLTGKEIIRRITEIYHAGYNLDNLNFDIYEQLLVCESLAKTEAEEQKKYGRTNENVSVSGMSNDSGKRNANFELIESKREAIAELRTCTYRTPPKKISSLLETLFSSHKSKSGHWLYIAQHYNPRAINRTITRMMKRHNSGEKSILNPSAYFTYTIKLRRKRRS
ncbi:MAG: hypothetical protein AAB600_01980 [Patescibacteria group bacterium]